MTPWQGGNRPGVFNFAWGLGYQGLGKEVYGISLGGGVGPGWSHRTENESDLGAHVRTEHHVVTIDSSAEQEGVSV